MNKRLLLFLALFLVFGCKSKNEDSPTAANENKKAAESPQSSPDKPNENKETKPAPSNNDPQSKTIEPAKKDTPKVKQEINYENFVIDLNSTEKSVSDKAMAMLKAGGSKAAPLLVKNLRSNQSMTRKLCFELLNDMTPHAEPHIETFAKILSEGDGRDETLKRVTKLLKNQGVKASPFAPELAKVYRFKRYSVLIEVTDILCAMGPAGEAAVPELIRYLGAKNRTQNLIYILKALDNIGTKSDIWLQYLKTQLTSGTSDEWKGRLLQHTASSGKNAMPILLTLVNDRSNYVKSNARRAIEKIGGDAVEPLIAFIQKKPNPKDQDTAIYLLGKLGPVSAPAIPMLEQICISEPKRQHMVLLSLSRMGDVAIPAITKLMLDHKLLEAPSSLANTGKKGALALAKALETIPQELFGAAAEALIRPAKTMGTELAPYLSDALKRCPPKYVSAILRALKECGPSAVVALPALSSLLLSDKQNINHVKTALLSCGAKSVPAFLQGLKSQDPNVRVVSLESLGKLGDTTPKVQAAKIKSLKDKEHSVRFAAIHSLAQPIQDSKKIVSALSQHFKKAQSVEQKAILKGFSTIQSKEAWSALIKCTRTNKNDVKLYAIGQLTQLPQFKLQSAPILIKFLRDKNPTVRSTACQVLGSLKADTSKVRSALQKATKDKDRTVASSARRALSKLPPQ